MDFGIKMVSKIDSHWCFFIKEIKFSKFNFLIVLESFKKTSQFRCEAVNRIPPPLSAGLIVRVLSFCSSCNACLCSLKILLCTFMFCFFFFFKSFTSCSTNVKYISIDTFHVCSHITLRKGFLAKLFTCSAYIFLTVHNLCIPL